MSLRARGQAQAIAAVRSMIAGPTPHAILLTGPPATGKTTLALDLAAGLLCSRPDDRPCWECRNCSRVGSGNHPDVHRLAPVGPGGQVRLGDPEQPEPGTVRRVVADLARHSMEGGPRIAIVEGAHRLNEDGQNALLKTLEEPPAGAVIVLCADDEERLLPTVRSRCARVRLGPLSVRAIEKLLEERGAADAPSAARLARLSWGRPGLAFAYAAAPGAAEIREEIARRLIDLLRADRRVRFAAMRELVGRAADLSQALEATSGAAPESNAARQSASRRRTRSELPVADATPADASPNGAAEPADVPAGPTERAAPGAETPAARRRAAAVLLEIWRSVGRDLAVAAAGGRRELVHAGLLDDLLAAAGGLSPAVVGAFLDRLAGVELLIDQNANPALALDVLVLSWLRLAAGEAAAPGPAAHQAEPRRAEAAPRG